MLDLNPDEATLASADAGFDTMPVTATVSPTLPPAEQATPMVNTAADAGRTEEPNADKSITDWNAVSAFMANVVAWPVKYRPRSHWPVVFHAKRGVRSDEEGRLPQQEALHQRLALPRR